MTTPPNSEQMNTQNPIQVTLLPPGTTNKQFDLNLEFYKKHQFKLYQKIISHQCESYQICLNPDESINIINLKTKATLYPSTQADIDLYFDSILNMIKIHVVEQAPFLKHHKDSDWYNRLHPLHSHLHQTLFDNSHFPELLNLEKGEIEFKKSKVNFLPLLRIYGIGLGNHIVKAIQQYDISCLVIHEIDFDQFYTSLYTTPWYEILPYFTDDPYRSCSLSFEKTPQLIESEKNLLSNLHPFFYSSRATLFGSLDRDFKEIIDAEAKFDLNNYTQLATGWYDDQARGLKHSIQNIVHKSAFYNGKKGSSTFRVFLVGSGPSLNESIDYLKQHTDDAIVIACGSAISTLVKNQIIPDYHIWQERPDGISSLLRFADEEIYKSVTCVKLNVVKPEVDNLYHDTLVMQKSNDPGSTLLPTDRFPQSYYVNPTVTNTGLSLCSFIGTNEVYLFGIDYGASENHTQMHAEGTTVIDDDGTTVIENKNDHIDKKNGRILEGNFSNKVYAKEVLFWSHLIAESAINDPDAKHISWINVGDGAKIKNATPMRPDDLPVKFKTACHKDAIKKQIKSLFSNDYSIQSVKQVIQNVHIPASRDFLLAMLDGFDSIPQSRLSLITIFGLIAKAASVGKEEESYLPKKLFGVDFVSFLNILYIQICSTESDQQAIELYKNAIPVLQNHVDAIFADFQNIAASIDVH